MRDRVHALKTWPKYFHHVLIGDKKFEVRYDDRGYKTGDVLKLQEFNPVVGDYTGSVLKTVVTYCLTGNQFGLKPNYCVLGIGPVFDVFLSGSKNG